MTTAAVFRKLRRLPDGRAMLNLGCGTVVAPGWNNADWSSMAWRARHKVLLRLACAAGLVSPDGFRTAIEVGSQIVYWDLRKGIPFDSGSFDVVYHSHCLEHLPKPAALPFTRECLRVLRPGGIVRVVVPDLKVLVDGYLKSVAAVDEGVGYPESGHEAAMIRLFDQMIRSEPGGQLFGLSGKAQREARPGLLRRLVRTFVRRDPARTGELHRWMYDKHSFSYLLKEADFEDVTEHTVDSSSVAGWTTFFLDRDEKGAERHEGSLYVEGTKTSARAGRADRAKA